MKALFIWVGVKMTRISNIAYMAIQLNSPDNITQETYLKYEPEETGRPQGL